MKKLLLLGLFVITGIISQAQNTFRNPILPGAYPDPSICRVGKDFYMVNSKESKYTHKCSLDGGSKYNLFTETASNLILSKGYTGAYLGFFAHSLKPKSDFADFDWIRCNY